ncbi:GNAT family N-acetyltransferase [Streptomyces sp. RS10V-4]|uniref:GNAT family N-acetyltransferase n=1 Tax=Streptomyces rhizoryzae TaxID=2932493 RepID=UPI0020064C8F|nr:GNAT family N-acetyltransferase [Streptomyces rhizoryzae]MCK7624324.1 GNAT family N-acetyltransferase [Streptomyces rhizoryzae]
MEITDATPQDWPGIWPFWHEIVAAGETYAWDRDTDEQTARALWMAPGSRVFAVRENGVPVASAYLRPNYGGGAARVANAGFMVAPAHAGRGIGRRLAEHVLDQARDAGYRAMVFNAVVATNPALGLWLSLGFTRTGTLPGAFTHPRLGPVDLHILHRTL